MNLPLERLAITLFSNVINLGYIYDYLMNSIRFDNERRDMKHLLEVVHIASCPMNSEKLSNKNDTKWNKFENRLMEIPSIDVVDSTETLLRNLSDYATFMDHLIDSNKDVGMLRRKKIIANWIGEDKKVASLFNKIENGVTVYSNFYFKEVFTKAVKHCDEKPRNRMKASLKHNYFSSPWVGASTITSVTLLILTDIQTILAITSASK
ncbi:hypothetical protein H5410_019944 [Solanum commersonii]|uniref:Uncharacterized protein n=1 Tax=Solanum commersonii TaxID=4109 RepID=A0A9J5Z9S8_SOLCO|nr:hypothetical protein H5410_019944 [Solanum commersonii]